MFWGKFKGFLHILPFIPSIAQCTSPPLPVTGMRLLSGVAPGIWNSFSATSMLHQFHLFLYLISSPLTISFNFSPSAFYINFITPCNVCDAVCMQSTNDLKCCWGLELTPCHGQGGSSSWAQGTAENSSILIFQHQPWGWRVGWAVWKAQEWSLQTKKKWNICKQSDGRDRRRNVEKPLFYLSR